MNTEWEGYMRMAIEEAKQSLREGDCGFGAVITRNNEIVAQAHDTEKTRSDPTAHAELTAIRMAAGKIGRSLDGCVIISTHEPCPMCSTAILWSGISTVVFGYSIREALEQGRNRIDLTCRELFERAGKPVKIIEGVVRSDCALLYDRHVRECVDQLRNADGQRLDAMASELGEKRVVWFQTNRDREEFQVGSSLERAYRVFLAKLGVSANDAPIVESGPERIVIHSRNFCPTLEACRILGLDTRHVCSRMTEAPMDTLLKQIDPRLRFSRNYAAIRPHCEYCEEIISLVE